MSNSRRPSDSTAVEADSHEKAASDAGSGPNKQTPPAGDRSMSEAERMRSRVYEESHGSGDSVATDLGSFEVSFEGPADPSHPHHWPMALRCYYTFMAALAVLNSTFSSVLPSSMISDMAQEDGFHFQTQEVGILIIAFFVLGYVFGPIIWGPLSERIGRKRTFMISMAVYFLFQMGCALAPNLGGLIAMRFISGLFGSAPLAVCGALLADIWDPKRRGIAMALFAVAPFSGPSMAPVIAGFMHVTGQDWRLVYWILFAFAGLVVVLFQLTMRETFAPVILARKAKKLRKETGDSRYYAPIERLDRGSYGHQAFVLVAKPFVMIAQEPMLLAITLYMSLIYGVLYLLFEAYPIVFEQEHGLNAGISGLMFIPFFLGGVSAVVVYTFVFNPMYVKKMQEYAPGMPPPETRLPQASLGAITLVIAFAWFGWTSYSFIPFWSPMFAGSLIGFSFLLIFLAFFNYMIDTYLMTAATALAINTIVRSIFGAVFPIAAIPMYANLGTRWATFLLFCLALLFAPLPFLLMKFGPKLRALSKNAPKLPPPGSKPQGPPQPPSGGAPSKPQ